MGNQDFTHEKSYCCVPRTSTEFTNVNFMRPLPSDWKCYERICEDVSSFEAKDSSGGNHQGVDRGFTTGRLQEEKRVHQSGLVGGLGNDFNSGDQPVGLSSDRGAVQATSEARNVTDVTFVETVPLKWQLSKYADEYDTNSENDFPHREDEDIPPITISRSWRPIRAYFRSDF